MGIFSKYEYKKIELPFYYIREKEDIEAGGFSIEAYGEINGQTQYFYASFILSDCRMYDNGDYNEMINILSIFYRIIKYLSRRRRKQRNEYNKKLCNSK